MNPLSASDYSARAAVAKLKNILVNSPNETKYFYQDLDANAARLNSANRYTITFDKDRIPPVNGFLVAVGLQRSITCFVANPVNRFSVGTKNKDLGFAADGSLTIYVRTDEPSTIPRSGNRWLPAPKGDFSLYVRAYWPKRRSRKFVDAASRVAVGQGDHSGGVER